MFVRSLVSAVGVLGIGTFGAIAADLPTKAPAPAIAAPYSWTGCYVGANGGWIGSRDSYDLAPSGSYLNPVGGTAPPNAAATGDHPADIVALSNSYSVRASGGLIGAQVGCNIQMGQFVFGAEGDWQWTGLSSSVSAAYAAFPNVVAGPAFTDAAHTETVSTQLQWLSTLRARGGIAFDRWFLYLTGGLAVADIQSATNVTFATFPVLPVFNGATHIGSDTRTRIGWVIGVGGEYAFGPHWSFKAEYLYIDFGTYSYLSPLVAATAPAVVGPGYSWSTSVHARDHVARLGLNYKF